MVKVINFMLCVILSQFKKKLGGKAYIPVREKENKTVTLCVNERVSGTEGNCEKDRTEAVLGVRCSVLRLTHLH